MVCFMFFNVILLLFVNHLKDVFVFVIYRLPDDWYYPWNHGRTYDLSWIFSTIIAIIRACTCWALFVVTLTNTVLYIYIYMAIKPFWIWIWKKHQEETYRPTQRFRCVFLDLLLLGWRGCASAMGVIKTPSSCSSPKPFTQSSHTVLHVE